MLIFNIDVSILNIIYVTSRLSIFPFFKTYFIEIFINRCSKYYFEKSNALTLSSTTIELLYVTSRLSTFFKHILLKVLLSNTVAIILKYIIHSNILELLHVTSPLIFFFFKSYFTEIFIAKYRKYY